MKSWLTTFIWGCLLTAASLQAQVPQELIDEAKKRGMTDEQIQQEIRKYVGTGNAASAPAQSPVRADSMAAARKTPEPAALQPQATGDLSHSVFGREIFSNKSLSFEPGLNIPTPKDYRLSAGDEVIINVWGASEMKFTQKISPDGFISIPNVGPVALSGLTVDQAAVQIKNELGRIMSGLVSREEPNTFVNVSLGQIRSIKINIVGEAMRPGTYTLPSLATLFNALYAAGGVNNIGTLRNIKVFRNSREIASLDVYEYLLKGKSDANIRLEDNDMVIVGPYENHVTIKGKVKRNRIFELKKDESLQQLIDYAGGFTGDAFTGNLRVTRRAGDRYSLATVERKDYPAFMLKDQDRVTVDSVIPQFANRLRISGAVWRAGAYELCPGISTVKELIAKAGGVKGDEFAGRAQITRTLPDFTTKIIAIDIKGILNGSAADIRLQREDELYIPSLFDLREEYKVTVRGAVNSPDSRLPYRDNMTVEDAILLAGGLKEAASMVKVEVARRIKNPYAEEYPDEMATVMQFTLSDNLKIINGEPAFKLQPFDEIIVRYSPGYRSQELVNVRGEVLFAGAYVLAYKNERLSDLVRKAGGISEQAFVKGASLKRKLTEDEIRKIETIVSMSQNSGSRDSISLQALNLRNYTVGIDLQKALKRPGSQDDIILRDGDELFIPQYQSTVKISGAVTYPNSVTYTKGMSLRDYLSQAGGYTDVSRKYPVVIYMNGKVATTKRTFIFFKKYPKVEPGAEILVPLKKQNPHRNSLAEILSIGTSATSMAAMVTSIVNMIQTNKK